MIHKNVIYVWKSSIEIPENARSFEWCYLHGKLEEDAGFDCFSVVEKDLAIIEGVNILWFSGKKCTFYYWECKFDGRIRPRGLCCYSDDLECLEYAKKQFEIKSKIL